MAHNQEKKRSIEGDPQVTEMRELLDKSFIECVGKVDQMYDKPGLQKELRTAQVLGHQLGPQLSGSFLFLFTPGQRSKMRAKPGPFPLF